MHDMIISHLDDGYDYYCMVMVYEKIIHNEINTTYAANE